MGQFDEAVEVFGIDGAAPVLRRRALEAISVDGEYLDENFFAHKEDHDISWRLHLAGWECWYVPDGGRPPRPNHARARLQRIPVGDPDASTGRELEKSQPVRVNAMKNQWLMLLKNEDGFNFVRDFPFILAREAMVVTHRLFFAPKSLVAIPMTIKLLPETLRKRRAAKRSQKMNAPPRPLRQLARPLGTVGVKSRRSDNVRDERPDNAGRPGGDRCGSRSSSTWSRRTRSRSSNGWRPRGMRAPGRLGDADGARSPLGSRDRSPVRPRPPRLVDVRSRLAREGLRLQDEVRHLPLRSRNDRFARSSPSRPTSSSPAAAESGRRPPTSRRWPHAGGEAGPSFPGGGASPARTPRGPAGSPTPG